MPSEISCFIYLCLWCWFSSENIKGQESLGICPEVAQAMRDISENWIQVRLLCQAPYNIVSVDHSGVNGKRWFSVLLMWWFEWEWVGGTLWEGLGDMTLSEEVPHGRQVLRLQNHSPSPIPLHPISCLQFEMWTLSCSHHHAVTLPSQTLTPWNCEASVLSFVSSLGHGVLSQQQENDQDS